MKAKELMINDWVKIDEPDKYAGSYAQIKSLYHHKEEDGAYFDVFIFGEKGLLMTSVFCDDLRPIPITTEILEKNGFENVGDDIYQLEEKPFWFWVDFDGHEYGCEHDTSTYENESSERILKLKGIPYVHELQHAMALFGIDKKIEL